VDADAVTLILTTIDRIKSLLEALERDHAEPAGDDDDLINRLQDVAAPKTSASGEGKGGGSLPGDASRKGHLQDRAMGLKARSSGSLPASRSKAPFASAPLRRAVIS
jgi:hypothetical protein